MSVAIIAGVDSSRVFSSSSRLAYSRSPPRFGVLLPVAGPTAQAAQILDAVAESFLLQDSLGRSLGQNFKQIVDAYAVEA